jgi:hypothetical protein
MKPASSGAFCQKLATLADINFGNLLPLGMQQKIGCFNVFNLEELLPHALGYLP